MDPFRYHDINELGTSPPDLDAGILPLNYSQCSDGVAMIPQSAHIRFSSSSTVSVPIVLPDTPGKISEVTGRTEQHLTKTWTCSSQPRLNIISNIVQNRPQSKPRAIPTTRTFLTHNHHKTKSIGIYSHCTFKNEAQGWQTSAYNCSLGTMSPPDSPPNFVCDLACSQTSSPPSSLTENGSWRRRTFSQTSFNMSEGFRPCSFCMKNGERSLFYNAHQLHYMENGRRKVACPILRSVRCPICGATGDIAHTLSHCPYSTDKVSVAVLLKNTARQCNGSLRKQFD